MPKNGYESLARLRQRLSSSPSDPLREVQRVLEEQPLSDTDLIELKSGINVTGRMDYESHDIYLHVDTIIEHDTRLQSCKKEPDTVKWVEDYMKPGDVFYDVGANVGAYSLVAARYFAGEVKVYAFEPAFLNFSQLCRNLILNKCSDTVMPLPVALSDQTTIGEFNYHSLVAGDSMHTFGEAIDYKGEDFTPAFTQPTLSYRLDDLIDQFKLPIPTHIKIDVDGIEKAVLEGAPETLSNSSLRSVVVELEEGEPEREITELLAAKGLHLDAKHTRWTPGMLNCIFSRKTA